MLLAIALVAATGASRCWALNASTIQLFDHVCKGKIFRLVSDVYEPASGGKPAPFLNMKGWHYRDSNRPLLFTAGDPVELTGIYPYGDNSLFLEITQPAGPEMLGFRLRVRLRIAADSGPDEPDKQEEELKVLFGKVLMPTEPLDWTLPEPATDQEPAPPQP